MFVLACSVFLVKDAFTFGTVIQATCSVTIAVIENFIVNVSSFSPIENVEGESEHTYHGRVWKKPCLLLPELTDKRIRLKIASI